MLRARRRHAGTAWRSEELSRFGSQLHPTPQRLTRESYVSRRTLNPQLQPPSRQQDPPRSGTLRATNMKHTITVLSRSPSSTTSSSFDVDMDSISCAHIAGERQKLSTQQQIKSNCFRELTCANEERNWVLKTLLSTHSWRSASGSDTISFLDAVTAFAGEQVLGKPHGLRHHFQVARVLQDGAP